MRLSRAQAEGFKVGDVKFSAHPTPDLSSWLLCDGSAKSRATYSALFAAIGITYGNGDGSTTFNIPDGARFLAAYKAADSDFGTVGVVGGEKAHALSVAELAAHVHTIPKNTDATFGTYAATHYAPNAGTLDSGSVGSGTAHNNIPPFLVMKMLIKFK